MIWKLLNDIYISPLFLYAFSYGTVQLYFSFLQVLKGIGRNVDILLACKVTSSLHFKGNNLSPAGETALPEPREIVGVQERRKEERLLNGVLCEGSKGHIDSCCSHNK